jgi:lytic murein transglycosylase B
MSALLAILGCCVSAGEANKPGAPYAERPEVNAFIGQMVARHGFEAKALKALFSKVQVRPGIIERMSSPAEAKPWYQYRQIFVTPERIREGIEFWRENAAALKRAEALYGVPAEIIVAIIGVETRYGGNTGSSPVLDAVATLAFDYPPRSRFFLSELEQFLLLCREEHIDPLSLTGSYAGAMGKPQFISSSYRQYAVDFDGNGKRDLWNNTADAIGSVANYFKVHAWHTGEPIVSRAVVNGRVPQRLLQMKLKPDQSLAKISRYGVTPEDKLSEDRLATLITLETEDGPEYWLGLHNFYVITRYNPSALYAMAVYQLSREILAVRGQ